VRSIAAALTDVTIPNSVTGVGNWVFEYCGRLTNVTIGNGVTGIGDDAFGYCTNLTSVHFQGNAPITYGPPFTGESGTVYYLPGATGWTNTFGGWSTALWLQPNPSILSNGPGFGIQSNGFGFSVFWATTDRAVVVEACTNVSGPWTRVATNTLVSGATAFTDAQWTNYPRRFYRVRSP
jgi:hypothetical protein